MNKPVDAARLLRDSNPVADDQFDGAAADSLGLATFERILHSGPEPALPASRSPRRPRRVALRWLAATGAALAAGALILVATALPGADDRGTGGPVVDTAYVVQRTETALSAAGPRAVAQLRVTASGPVGPVTSEEWSYGDQWRSVLYSPAGQPVFDRGFSPKSGYTVVSYPARTWSRDSGLGGPGTLTPPGGCGRVIADLPTLFEPELSGASSPAATIASVLRAAISCGTLAVAGHQRVDGVEAIELASRPGRPGSETVWVSPATYLPVRVTVRVGSGTAAFQRTADITWLAPTAQNQSRLTVPIPAGFRHVPSGPTVSPVSP
jgi:hypothetical protein